MEKRQFKRVQVDNLQIDLSDGMGCCSGQVSNISRRGLAVAEISGRFGRQADAFTAVVSDGVNHFKFRLYPCWEHPGEPNKTMGLRIAGSVPEWDSYVRKLEREEVA
jgi:hypothetical protein